ncbi:MAG: hypothetical protein E7E64_14125 [Clostridium celatum]|nr:hypothetical protein [Clostridium celatum]MDU4979995.1 hypothetical protein [Clostridium celatum]
MKIKKERMKIMIDKKSKKDYSNGLIEGVIPCEEEEEKKLRHENEPKSKSGITDIFNFPNLN